MYSIIRLKAKLKLNNSQILVNIHCRLRAQREIKILKFTLEKLPGSCIACEFEAGYPDLPVV